MLVQKLSLSLSLSLSGGGFCRRCQVFALCHSLALTFPSFFAVSATLTHSCTPYAYLLDLLITKTTKLLALQLQKQSLGFCNSQKTQHSWHSNIWFVVISFEVAIILPYSDCLLFNEGTSFYSFLLPRKTCVVPGYHCYSKSETIEVCTQGRSLMGVTCR